MKTKLFLGVFGLFVHVSVFSQVLVYGRGEEYKIPREQCISYTDQMVKYIKSLGLFTEGYLFKEDTRSDWKFGAREMMRVNDTLDFLQNYDFFIRTSYDVQNGENSYDCGVIEIGYKTETDAIEFYKKSKTVKNSMLSFNEGIISVEFKSVRYKKSVFFVYIMLNFTPREEIKHLFNVIEDWKPVDK